MFKFMKRYRGYQVISAKFIGEDMSLGLRNGKVYKIVVNSGYYECKPVLWVSWDGKYNCAYSNEKTFAQNWEIL